MSHILYITFRGLQKLEPSYRFRSKESWLGRVLKRSIIVLHSNSLGEVIRVFSSDAGFIPWDGNGEVTTAGSRHEAAT